MSDKKEPSLLDYAKRGLDSIGELSKSQKTSEKLQSVDNLLFVLIATVYLSFFLGGSTMNGLSLAVIGVGCLIVSFIAVNGYVELLSIVVNVSPNKIETLRIGITMLFISLAIGVAALVFDNSFLGNLSLGLLGLQLVVMLTSGFFLPRTPVEDKEIERNQVWDALGKISSITGIISLIIDVVLPLIKASLKV